MRKITHIAALTAAAATLLLADALPAAPTAALSPQAAVTARKAGFKKMGAAMKALKEQLALDAPAKPVLVSNAQIVAATARDQPKLFPAGSTSPDALPAIWSDRATFDAQMTKLLAETGKLQAVANSGNVAAVQAQFKATGAVCAACHRQFRSDN